MNDNIEIKELVSKLEKLNFSSDTIIKTILCEKRDEAINIIEKYPNILESEYVKILKV